jgi:hypothetical protein
MNFVIDEHVKHVLSHQEACITKMVEVASEIRACAPTKPTKPTKKERKR